MGPRQRWFIAIPLFIVGVTVIALAVARPDLLQGRKVLNFAIDQPRQLDAQAEQASVCGLLKCSGWIRLSELRIVIYVTGVRPDQAGRWWRSNVPCVTQIGRQWTISPECTSFPKDYSEFFLVAIVVKEDDAARLPPDLIVKDVDELVGRLYKYAYPPCDDSTPCKSISPVFPLSRSAIALSPTEAPTPIAPTSTPTPTSSPTPTSTPTPTPTKTPTPTHTPTITPTAPPTLAPTIPPVPSPYPPPELTKVDIMGCSATFYWSWTGVLNTDEYFALRARIGAPGESRTWIKETQYTLPLRDTGEYVWEVAICRGDPATHICEQLAVSEQGVFEFRGCVSPDRPRGG